MWLVLILALLHALFFTKRTKGLLVILLVADIVLLASAPFLLGYELFGYEADTWVHLTLIKSTMEEGIFPKFPFYAEPFPMTPHYSLWHIVLAQTHLDPALLFFYVRPIVLVAAFLGMFLWINELTNDKGIALLSSMMILVVTNIKTWAYSSYPGMAGMATGAFALYFWTRGSNKNNTVYQATGGVMTGITFATHQIWGGVTLIFAIAYKAFHKSKLRTLIIPLIIINLPWLFLLLNPLQSGYHKTGAVKTMAGMLSPAILLKIIPGTAAIMFIFAGIAIARTLKRKATKQEKYSLLALSSILAFVLAFSLLNYFMPGWAIRRAVKYVSIFFVILTLIVLRNVKANFIIVAAVLIAIASPFVNSVQPCTRCAVNIDDGFEALNGLGEGVVLSDPYTSYFIPFKTGNKVVTMPPSHGSPYINHMERIRDAGKVLNTTTPDFSILKKYNVRFIMVNLRSNGKYPQNLGMRYYDKSINKNLENLTLLYEKDRVWIYGTTKVSG